MSSPSRGIRNHNPGNIDYHSGNRWKGQLGMEEGCACPRFARFDCAENGIRALAKLLLNYGGKDGLPNMGGLGIDTVLEIIQRWAPSNENDTLAYATVVAGKLGVGITEAIDIREPATLFKLVVAVITHENGSNPYPPAMIAEGIRRATS
jgi:hypothetical protein